MHHLDARSPEISCQLAGRRYQEAAWFIATLAAHVEVFGDAEQGSFVSMIGRGLSEDEIEMLR